MKDEEIKENVRKGYAKIVSTQVSCCGPSISCCGPNTQNTVKLISQNIGYTEVDCASVPEGANLGLGCGNPLAHAKIKEGDTILDLGSGAGFDCFLAAKRTGPTGLVIGIDMTPEMIAAAKKNAQEGNFNNVQFRLGEIEHLPVDSDSIDMIISNCVINLVPNKEKAFREAFRVLKPGGLLMVSDIVLLSELPEIIRNSIDAYIGCVSGALLKEDYLLAIKNSGFRDIKIHESTPFPIDISNFNPVIIEDVKKIGYSLEGIKKLTQSVISIKVEAMRPQQELKTLFKADKLKVEIYVPLGTCACNWDQFMNKTFEVLTPYIKYIDHSTKDYQSEEAHKQGIYGNCILIEGKYRFTSSHLLKKRLPELLKEKGLLL